VRATRIPQALDAIEAIARDSTTGKVHLVGYSFGGLLAALLASRSPELVASLTLIAPAIDNFDRNYKDRRWRMPNVYVEELQQLPARPLLNPASYPGPTVVVHGIYDSTASWRVREWATECNLTLHEPECDHSLLGWRCHPGPALEGGEPNSPASTTTPVIPTLGEIVAAAVATAEIRDECDE
jgi:pimeloyl-ACP methyl ester carboxylesterase